MARTVGMNHPRPLPSSAPSGGKPARVPTPPVTGKRGHLIAAALALGALAIGAGLWLWTPSAPPAPPPGAQLLAEMAAAAGGGGAPTHVFGGALAVTQANGRVAVTAEAVPSRVCVQAGWQLAKTGTVIVNGTLPMRLSAARLSELCSGDTATLTWVPDQPAPAAPQ